MNEITSKAEGGSCLKCGHRFGATDYAAMVACKESIDLCVIDCSVCGTHNLVRAEPTAGFDEQPDVVVLGISSERPQTAEVFDETVDSGIDVHPVTRGKSN